MKELVDVAFNNNIKKVTKKSFASTIDVQLGVYQAEPYKGWLSINLKPSHGIKDWLINFIASPGKMDDGAAHKGYLMEIQKYKMDLLALIQDNDELLQARDKGTLIAGRSKGAAEALLIGYDFWFPGYRIRIGAIEPPRCVSKGLAEDMERLIGKSNIHYTIYRNDIVPGLPFWFTIPGIKHQIEKRTHGLSIKDHETATTEEEVIYGGI